MDDTPGVTPTMAMVAGPLVDELVGLGAGPEAAAEGTFPTSACDQAPSLLPMYRVVDSMLGQTEVDQV